MDTKVKIGHLQSIYNQQHYFVDRHDSMAEKFINILLAELSCISVVYAIVFNGAEVLHPKWYQILLIVAFVILFMTSLINLLLIVRPLSSKAKKYRDESLLGKSNKAWVKKSSLYYQGIINQIDSALADNKVPSDCFVEQLTEENLANDLTQQIFILAQYSNYKKEKLECVIWLIVATTVLGIASIASLAFL